MPRLFWSSARSPSRIASIRSHGSHTIVISKTASSPTRTRWPIGHCSTSVPSTVRFSLVTPGSRSSESRCSFEMKSTSRFGGFAWAQPSRPWPGMARRRSCGVACAVLRPGDVQTLVTFAIELILRADSGALELDPVQVEQVGAGLAASDGPEHEEQLVGAGHGDWEVLARPGGGVAGRDQVVRLLVGGRN